MWRRQHYGRTPWREMERLQREMNRLFSEAPQWFGSRATQGYPAMNVWANEDGLVITAELPGLSPEDIEISVVGDTLTLSGTREPEALEEGMTYHRRERNYGNFKRVFQLPFKVEAEKVAAIFDKGVLSVTLPRAEADKPLKITIKAG